MVVLGMMRGLSHRMPCQHDGPEDYALVALGEDGVVYPLHPEFADAVVTFESAKALGFALQELLRADPCLPAWVTISTNPMLCVTNADALSKQQKTLIAWHLVMQHPLVKLLLTDPNKLRGVKNVFFAGHRSQVLRTLQIVHKAVVDCDQKEMESPRSASATRSPGAASSGKRRGPRGTISLIERLQALDEQWKAVVVWNEEEVFEPAVPVPGKKGKEFSQEVKLIFEACQMLVWAALYLCGVPAERRDRYGDCYDVEPKWALHEIARMMLVSSMHRLQAEDRRLGLAESKRRVLAERMGLVLELLDEMDAWDVEFEVEQ